MHDCGYPVEDFGERAGLVAAHHPQIAEHYRAARTVRQAYHGGHVGQSGAVDTEELRQAFGHYRALFGAFASHLYGAGVRLVGAM